MSVFDLGAETMDEQGAVTVVDPKIITFPGSSYDGKLSSNASHAQPSAGAGAAPPALPCDPSHRHHDSTSTQASESADSSPTTTMSCTDSSSLSDPSPSSSPDSPVNLVPLAALPGPSFGGFSSMSVGLASLSVSDANSHTLERPMTSPSPRRARNMKGLSIQPPFVSPTLPAARVSEPTSPSFIKPQIPAMRRKPSQLSLKTSTHELVKSTTIEVPQSPSLMMPPILQRRALKHSTSSPHMLSSLKSATFGPMGGMTFPTVLERNESGLSEFLRPSRPTGSAGFDSTILEEESPIRTQIASRAAFEFEPFHELENNEDQKTPGYPDGPIAIYGDNVFLYLEPTAEEASRFDVVINVAREVHNPFKLRLAKEPARPLSSHHRQSSHELKLSLPKLAPILEPESEEPEIREVDESVPTVLEPPPTLVEPAPSNDAAEVGEASTTPVDTQESAPALALALPELGSADTFHEDNSPTTPKATLPLKEPEYIHIPWDHNTDIGEDLLMLCETIEKKTKEGKKVLIHCQQGASRSASLIIAYGIYQNPELSVNDAYYAAQAKSKWISPNMRLMYCLQDFQKEVGKKRLPPNSALRPRSDRSPTKHHRMTLSVDAIDSPQKEPFSAPLPVEDPNGKGGSGSPERIPTRPRGNSTPNSREAISPGPSSAPSSFSWDEKEDENDPQKFGRFNFGFPPATPEPPKLSLPVTSDRKSSTLSLPGSGMDLMHMKPPPSPGFAAHRFGQFPMNLRPNPLSSGLPPLSPGFPPHSGSNGLDSILAESREPTTTTTSMSTTTTTTATTAIRQTTFSPLEQPTAKVPEHTVSIRAAFDVDEPLMSPRVETMTNNPLHDQFAQYAGMSFVEVPPTPSEGLFSPRETMFPRDPFFPFGRPTQVADPRSPPTKGETPIVRSIDELM